MRLHPDPKGTIESPQIGDIRRGVEVGYHTANLLIFHACVDCGTTRWVKMIDEQPMVLRCQICSRHNHASAQKAVQTKIAQGTLAAYPIPRGTIEDPQEGDIRSGKELGRNNWSKYIWHGCDICGKKRWATLENRAVAYTLCRSCRAKTAARREQISAARLRYFGNEPQTAKGDPKHPQVGDIQRGTSVGFKNSGWHIRQACLDCGTERWVVLRHGKPDRMRCQQCAPYTPDALIKKRQTRIERGTTRVFPTPKGTIEKPELGDIRRGYEIGKEEKHPYIYHACVDCNKGRWVRIGTNLESKSPRCTRCSLAEPTRRAKLSAALKGRHLGNRPRIWGNRKKHSGGYIYISVAPDDFFASMRNKKGYVLEHRYVMAKKLGRLLHPWEDVHHKDLNRSNNDISNLELRMKGHGAGTNTKVQLVSKLHEAKARIKQLEIELRIQLESAAPIDKATELE